MIRNVLIAACVFACASGFACVHMVPGEGGGGTYTVDKWGASQSGKR